MASRIERLQQKANAAKRSAKPNRGRASRVKPADGPGPDLTETVSGESQDETQMKWQQSEEGTHDRDPAEG